MTAVPATPSPSLPRTRNDAFKERFSSGLWFSIIVAAVIHFVAFLAWPTLHAESWISASAPEPELVRIDEYDIPPPPDQPTQPKRPTPITADVSTDITIEKAIWDKFPPDLPPPPTAPRGTAGNRARGIRQGLHSATRSSAESTFSPATTKSAGSIFSAVLSFAFACRRTRTANRANAK